MGTTQSSIDNEDQPSTEAKKTNELQFHVQDVKHTVKSEDIDPNTSLIFYLRNTLHMTGTKAMCYEGGCGACVVVLQNTDPLTKKDVFLAVNSCLIPLLSCSGWRIYTIEGIGNPVEKYHPLQERLAQYNGTQCGFCSPGMVMSMYGLYTTEVGKPTKAQVEKTLDGNICRCTGYRSVLSAFKSFCEDSSCPDIEDLHIPCRKKCNETKAKAAESFGSKWIKVHALRDLQRTLSLNPTSSYRLVAGNTAQGVYNSYKENVDLYIDITDVEALKVEEIHDNVCVLGANTTLTNAIEFLNNVGNTYPQFTYFRDLAAHIELVANTPVRNRGTLAGNLMIKHDHNEFPSDIFLILETIGAILTIVDLEEQETKMRPLQFLGHNMNRRILKTISLSSLSSLQTFKSFKIMPRAQNTHAFINAGFLFTFNQNELLQSATLVYGNISDTFVHANQTEGFLVGKNLFDNSVLQQAYKSLNAEVNPKVMPPEPSPQFRKQLSVALFYKGVLAIAPAGIVSSRNKSGGGMIERPVSNGTQEYDTDKTVYPVSEALPKIEALAQTSGQAQYVEDMPDQPSQLFAALVLAETPPNSTITNIDASAALKCKGIVAFYTKDDIPGENSFSHPIPPVATAKEEIFCSGRVQYYEQPIGVLIGESQEDVDGAVGLVEVSYDPPTVEPLLSVRQVLKAGRQDRVNEYKTINATRRGNDTKRVIEGKFDIYHQYHFHMETQTCNVIPNEDGLEVHASTQWMHLTQLAIAKMLSISESEVTVHVRRCGGAFGAKLTRNGLVSCAASLASWKLKRPVKMRLPLTTNMTAIGKRFPFSADYKVGVNDKGQIQYLECSVYTDVGIVFNGDFSSYLSGILTNTYVSDTFTIHMNTVVTDTHANTWMRAPGSNEGLALIETIMEHVSYEINVDPIDVRLANLAQGSPLNQYISDVKTWANTDQLKSEIEAFNKQNRWRKRGLAVVPMNFDVPPLGSHFATVSIFQGDGSVQISHGGVEIGQGINTKAAQVCAYKLNISVDKVKILPSNSFISANNLPTGGSIASDGICYAVGSACDELLKRIGPYRVDGAKWEDTIQKAFEANVSLVATAKYSPEEPGVNSYTVYGVCVAEVEVDILTGKHIVTRVHISEDTGRSINPYIDIGQVEGAFVMGMGYYTSEEIQFSWEGKVLNRNTWTYYPPGAQDIPVNFLVKFPKNSPNPLGVFKSKGTGEPAFCLSIAVPFAIMNAVASARVDASPSNPKWYGIDGPATVPNIFLNSLNDSKQYTL